MTEEPAEGAPPEAESRVPELEALLFATPEPLSLSDLRRMLSDDEEPLPEALVKADLERLGERLARSGSALEVQRLAGGFRLATRPEHAGLLRRLFTEQRDRGLTPAALETLSIIAYRQPVTRMEIESIRGVGCGPILKTLLDRKLVRYAGRKEGAVGRPHTYGTTPEFLEAFGLGGLSDLPELAPGNELGLTAPPPAAPEEEAEEAAGEEMAAAEQDAPVPASEAEGTEEAEEPEPEDEGEE